jgi:hypothetical protein
MIIAIIVVVAIVVIAVLYYIGKRNSIIAARNRVDESWSGIDVQLKRRHDLVPNLSRRSRATPRTRAKCSRKRPKLVPRRCRPAASTTPRKRSRNSAAP